MWDNVFGSKDEKVEYPFPSIKLESKKLIEKDKAELSILKQRLRKDGYVVIKLDSKTIELVKKFRKESYEFFSKPVSFKKNYSPKLEEVNKRRNIGWIPVGGKKEFIKLRKGFVEEFPESFSNAYLSLEKFFLEISETCFESIAKTKCKSTGKPLIDAKLHEALVDQHRNFSYLTAVKYPSVEDLQNNENQFPSLHYPSRTHCDMGILSFIICSEVPGLQLNVSRDPNREVYEDVEKFLDPITEMIIIPGKKLEILSNEEIYYKATLHRVCLPTNVTRYSTIYFCDVP